LDVIENAYECGSLGSFAPTRSVSVPADDEVQIWGGTLPTKGARRGPPGISWPSAAGKSLVDEKAAQSAVTEVLD